MPERRQEPGKTENDLDLSKLRSATRVDPCLFFALTGADPRAGGSRHVLAGIDQVILGRGEVVRAERTVDGGARTLLVEIPDGRMSARHARLARSEDRWFVEDTRSRNGVRVNGSSVERVELEDGDVIELGRTAFIFRSEVTTTAGTRPDLGLAGLAHLDVAFRTLLPEVSQTLEELARVARDTTAPILLLGETGTGKEVLARAIHALSGRPGKLVAINCGALPEALVEGLLFGFMKGAFTGAAIDEPGFVRAADGGTLFLDEIGDLPLGSQTAFLRVLQEKEVTPVGSTRAVGVDVRVVAATHAPLNELIERGSFRSGLYARLAAYTHRIPPLRERREDLGLIMSAMIDGDELRFSAEVVRSLIQYDWPRNIRELEQWLSVIGALAAGEEVAVRHLSEDMRRGKAPESLSVEDGRLRASLISEMERHRGNISEVARAMGKARMQIQRWLKRFAVDPEHYR